MNRLGKIKATIFNKTSKDGKHYKQVALSKSEKQQNGEWKETTLFLFPEEVAHIMAVVQAIMPELTYVAPKAKDTPPAQSTGGWEAPATELNDEIPW
jgi:hypothetical protein